MKSILSGNITFPGGTPELWIAVCMMLLCCGSGDARRHEAEQMVRDKLARSAECYALVLQTGRVTLPSGGRYPHVLYPERGGTETPVPNLWLVNAGYMGEISECRGCDSCMASYRDAGLVSYQVEQRHGASVTAVVHLTGQGRQYLVENQVSGFHPIVNAWRRREQLEVVVVAREQYEEVTATPADTAGVYLCEARRRLLVTPFLKAVGGTGVKGGKPCMRRFRVDFRQKPATCVEVTD